jgi:hypothetical protein
MAVWSGAEIIDGKQATIEAGKKSLGTDYRCGAVENLIYETPQYSWCSM